MARKSRALELPAEVLLRVQREIAPGKLNRAVRQVFKSEARRVRKVVIRKMASMPNSWDKAKDIGQKSIRAGVTRRGVIGYYVSATFRRSGNVGMYTNSRGLMKPLAFWMNTGTDNKGGRVTRKGFKRGSTTGLHYIEDTEREELERSRVNIGHSYNLAIKRIAERANMDLS